jgi:hypothetical protein
MFKQLENSIVQITSKPPNPQSPNISTSGSGFVYDNQGHIVTNSHVVGGAVEMDVTFSDGNKYTANVIADDIYNDIAVLQVSQNARLDKLAILAQNPLTIERLTQDSAFKELLRLIEIKLDQYPRFIERLLDKGLFENNDAGIAWFANDLVQKCLAKRLNKEFPGNYKEYHKKAAEFYESLGIN